MVKIFPKATDQEKENHSQWSLILPNTPPMEMNDIVINKDIVI
jgi:hypothetical protein